jgi:hypothetical protein
MVFYQNQNGWQFRNSELYSEEQNEMLWYSAEVF